MKKHCVYFSLSAILFLVFLYFLGVFCFKSSLFFSSDPGWLLVSSLVIGFCFLVVAIIFLMLGMIEKNLFKQQKKHPEKPRQNNLPETPKNY